METIGKPVWEWVLTFDFGLYLQKNDQLFEKSTECTASNFLTTSENLWSLEVPFGINYVKVIQNVNLIWVLNATNKDRTSLVNCFYFRYAQICDLRVLLNDGMSLSTKMNPFQLNKIIMSGVHSNIFF